MSLILMRKNLGGKLEPVDDAGRAVLQKVAVGDVIMCETKRVRNPDHHRKFFAMLGLIYQNQNRYRDMDDMLDAIKIHVGHAKTMQLRDGTIVKVPRSIAFHKLDQSGFEEFYDKVLDVVVTEIIPGLSKAELARELEAFAA